MNSDFQSFDVQQSRRLRLTTLIRLRWLAAAGQSLAVLVVAFGFDFPFPVALCFVLIACSAALNLFLVSRFPPAHRLSPGAAFGILMFDVLQLAGLLYMTGGLTNPFAVLIIVPVVVSATTLPIRMTVALGIAVVICTSLLVFFHLPLPWYPDTPLSIPFVFVAGLWMAIFSSLTFTAIYAWRVAEEARQLADALSATELVLQREQHLSALDGLAAAAAHELGTPLATIALVAREMQGALGEDERFGEDVSLLRSQSERCREILKRLTSLSAENEGHMTRLPLTSLIEEVIAPHRDFGIDIRIEPGETAGPEPVGRRNPGVIYGLGNIVENAVDFARETVTVSWTWDDQSVSLRVVDDGPGFTPDKLDQIGEPYAGGRSSRQRGGLGLGLFIAKTLLERSGAELHFHNSAEPGLGAAVEVVWPRQALVIADQKNLERA